MYIGVKILSILLSLLCIFFTFIGIYALDLSLIFIGVLFAIAIVLITLETKHKVSNPFKGH
ncbi:hypothetical protein D7V20_01795 [Acinetobacter rongchengensis]|uniref:Uncharacterized protein n=1 Tax=Acinetobacter rongchengensis TaxID=2419601 RepID=A0A3A8F3Q4_9GAMM|nr:hypothetical protein D7V20_01795 [Acinetobacter rongchengensis]